MQQLQHLLDKLELISLRQEGRKSTDSFNIFRLLRPEHDEVHLHSRFIQELLNPKGSHGMGNIFLRLFAETCNAATETHCFPALSYDTVQVLREHSNIDILIQDKFHAVVIENKIYARDQHEQLKRYHDFAVRSLRTPTLFYLTLDGNTPSNWSTSDLQAEVKCLAYSQEIDRWLTACIKEAATQPTLRETIIQYQQLIHQLTGKNMNEEENQQVLNLMAKDNNAEQAAIIERNWYYIRWHTEYNFWNELLALVETKYEVLKVEQFSSDLIDNIFWARGKDYTYGILFKVGKIEDRDVYFKMERGKGPTYYGVRNPFEDEENQQRLNSALQALPEGTREGFARWEYTKAGIDFQNFSSSPATLQLANPDKRGAIVAALCQEIQKFIAEALISMGKEFSDNFTPIPPKA